MRSPRSQNKLDHLYSASKNRIGVHDALRENKFRVLDLEGNESYNVARHETTKSNSRNHYDRLAFC